MYCELITLTFPNGNLLRKASDLLVSPNLKSGSWEQTLIFAPLYSAAIWPLNARKFSGYVYSVCGEKTRNMPLKLLWQPCFTILSRNYTTWMKDSSDKMQLFTPAIFGINCSRPKTWKRKWNLLVGRWQNKWRHLWHKRIFYNVLNINSVRSTDAERLNFKFNCTLRMSVFTKTRMLSGQESEFF